MKLNVNERLQFQFLLPMESDEETLTTVEGILKKLYVDKQDEKEREFKFTGEELELMKNSVEFLNQAKRIPFSALSTIRKIKGEKS